MTEAEAIATLTATLGARVVEVIEHQDLDYAELKPPEASEFA